MPTANNKKHPHLAKSVIMVEPVDFAFNEQTGVDNEFQHRPKMDESEAIRQTAKLEFSKSILQLELLGIEVLTLKKEHTSNILPDAVFPNNWFSTRADGKIVIYPMKTPNRQNEVQQPQLTNLVTEANYRMDEIIDLRRLLSNKSALEGTGSIIFHHPTNQIFAAISERCVEASLIEYAELFGYKLNSFNTSSAQGNPIYHTNVLMSCGADFAVITEEVIAKNNISEIIRTLSETVNDVIVITEEQMAMNFCGNILQLTDQQNQPVIALSKSAFDGFKPKQRKQLENHGSLAICEIPTIEKIGGGSTRCMLAENFLIKNS